MKLSARTRRLALATGVTTLVAVTGAVVLLENADAATSCPDVEVSFARGTGEAPGTGILGAPLVRGLQSALPGRTVGTYAVNYPADAAQAGDGNGATDLTNHLTAMASQCPNTRFVVGGYSQGASVVDIAFGAGGVLGRGSVVPQAVAERVAAVTVFGNPLRLTGGSLETANTAVRGRVLDLCNAGDPVCGAGGNFAAHLQYASNGAVGKAASFAAGKLAGTGTNPTPAPGQTATPTPTPTPTPTRTPGTGWWPGTGSGWDGSGWTGSGWTGSGWDGSGWTGWTGSGAGASDLRSFWEQVAARLRAAPKA